MAIELATNRDVSYGDSEPAVRRMRRPDALRELIECEECARRRYEQKIRCESRQKSGLKIGVRKSPREPTNEEHVKRFDLGTHN